MSNIESLPNDEKAVIPVESHAESIANPDHPDRNEDTFINDAKHGIFGVFDGMGGYNGGKEASRLASNEIWSSLLNSLVSSKNIDENIPLNDIVNFVGNAFLKANKKVIEMQQSYPEFSNMGTTASIIKILNRKGGKFALIANAGDSRVYTYRKNRNPPLFLHTDDDGIVMYKYKNDPKRARVIQDVLDNCDGPPPPEYSELRDLYNQRNKIFNNIGSFDMEPRITAIKLEQGDFVIITSDGVHDNLTRKGFESIVKSQRSARNLSNALVSFASRTRGRRRKNDDITAVVVVVK